MAIRRFVAVWVNTVTLLSAFSFGARAQQVSMRLLHQFPDGYLRPQAADSDHNGKEEIHALRIVLPANTMYDVLERRGVNDWQLALREPVAAGIYDGGDCDGDGRYELLRRSETNGIEIYEAPDAHSFPSQIVYTNPNIGFFQAPILFAENVPSQGHCSIIYTMSNATQLEVVVLENTGDNTYEEIARPQFGSAMNDPGDVVSGDFDSDGRPDLLAADSGGNIYVLENRAGSAFDLVWQMNLTFDFIDTLEYIGDGDGDGLPEFAVATLSPPRLWIFEPVGDDQYAPSFIGELPPTTVQMLRAADVNGDGRNEILAAANSLSLWKATANDSWEIVWQSQAGGLEEVNVLASDLNNDGFAEIFYTDFNMRQSYLVEWPWRVDASQNDLDRRGDALLTFRGRQTLSGILIEADGRNVTRRIYDWILRGNPYASVTRQDDETIVRLDLPGLGVASGRRIHFRVQAQDRQSGEIFQDQFDYIAP